MPRNILGSVRCTAHRTNGDPCKQWARRGTHVCVSHGALIPAVKAAAAKSVMERLNDLVSPAINRIARTIADDDNPQLALAAARDILDRAGYKATEKVQSDGRVVIEIEYVDRPNALNPPPPTNGTVH